MPRALITGITGQDGLYLAELLVAKGYEVYGLIRGQNNPKAELVAREVPSVRVVTGDLTASGSNLERNTYALRAVDGKVMWHLDIGKYSPGIVTDRHYFFTLNGIVQAWHGRRAPQILELKRRLAAQRRVAATPKKRTP